MGLRLNHRRKMKMHYMALILGALVFISTPVIGTLEQVANAVTGLTAPTLVSPVNNAVVNGVSLTNSWGSVPGAAKYEYQSYNDAAETQIRFDSYFTTTSKTAANVTDGTVFWWRVRAIDASNAVGPWSDLWKVTVDNTAPSVPQNGLPNNSSLDTNDFYFTWTASTDANPVTYQFQSSMNPAIDEKGVLTTNVWHSGVLSTPQIHSVGAPNGTWYWQVRAIDAAGNASAWSSLWKMTIVPDTTGPTVQITNPTASNYVKGSVMVAGMVTDSHPDHYYLAVQDSTGKVVAGPGIVYQKEMQTWLWDTTKLPDGIYTIDLEARDALGNKGPQSIQTLKVTVDNTVPVSDIALTSPASPTASTDMVFGGTVVTSAAASLKQLELWIDGKAYADITNAVDPVTKKWTYVLVGGLDKGDHKIAIVATDAAGNVSVETATSFVSVVVSGYVIPITSGAGTISLSVAPQPISPAVTSTQPAALIIASTRPSQSSVVNSVQTPASSTPNNPSVLGAESTKSPATLSTSTSQPIAPSASGWKLFGIAWYWWLLLLALMVGVGSWARVVASRRQEAA